MELVGFEMKRCECAVPAQPTQASGGLRADALTYPCSVPRIGAEGGCYAACHLERLGDSLAFHPEPPALPRGPPRRWIVCCATPGPVMYGNSKTPWNAPQSWPAVSGLGQAPHQPSRPSRRWPRWRSLTSSGPWSGVAGVTPGQQRYWALVVLPCGASWGNITSRQASIHERN